MKTHLQVALSFLLLTTPQFYCLAQTPVSDQIWSGQITYEAVRKIDPSSMRIMINGEQVKPGDPNFPSDIPDTRTFGQKVSFSNKYAKEDRDEQNMVRRIINDGGAPQSSNLGRPFEEKVYIDLSNQKMVTLLTVGNDKEAKTYRAEKPIQRTSGWQLTDQTRKIAGYTCRKATVPYHNETYTVWVTTELPLTYSPVHELTPEAGVVLLIEGSREQFRAMKISNTLPAATDIQPSAQAQVVTADQLTDLRQKALADFQQQVMTGERN